MLQYGKTPKFHAGGQKYTTIPQILQGITTLQSLFVPVEAITIWE